MSFLLLLLLLLLSLQCLFHPPPPLFPPSWRSWHGPVSKTKDADRPSRAARRAAASAVPARRPPLRRWREPVGPPRAVAGARRRGGRALHEAGAGRGTGGERFGRGPRGGRPRGRRGGGHGEGAQHSGDVDRSDRPRGDALSAPGLEAVRVVATSGGELDPYHTSPTTRRVGD